MNAERLDKIRQFSKSLQGEGKDISHALLVGQIASVVLDECIAELDTFQPSGVPCYKCSGAVVEFSVPNDAWNAIVRKGGAETDQEYLCLNCFAGIAQVEVQRLREEAAQYRQESRTNDGVLFSELASAYVGKLANKCREAAALRWTATELGKEVERLRLLDQVADEGAVRPGWWGRVAARLQERVTELEAEVTRLRTENADLRKRFAALRVGPRPEGGWPYEDEAAEKVEGE